MQVKEKCNMAHVIRAIDGKHIRVKCPKLTASQYFNSKGFFSMVLLGICDASYCFVLFDLGSICEQNQNLQLQALRSSRCNRKLLWKTLLQMAYFHKPIKVSINNVERYTLASMTLQNFLHQTDNAYYTPKGIIYSEDSNGRIKPGHLRTGLLVDMENNCFQNLNAICGSCYSNSALEMQENLNKYVIC